MKYQIGLSLALGLAWLLWSGHHSPLLLTLGALSCIGVVAIGTAMRLVDAEGVPVGLFFRALSYAPWLLLEIAKANVDVAWRILHPRRPIHPSIVRVRASQRRDLGRVIYANSITLTPGTVSNDMEDGEIVVHALTRESARALETGEMDRRVRRMDG